MPDYENHFAGLRDYTQVMAATKQASASRLLWHCSGPAPGIVG